MKKITRIFALALALVMAFALQAPVNAAEKAAVPVMDREMEATTMTRPRTPRGSKWVCSASRWKPPHFI